MPTKRTRITRPQQRKFSNTLLYTATDGLWGDPAQLDTREHFFDDRYTTRRCIVWESIRDELLPQWIAARPGTRPSWWYELDPDCPRISAEDIERHGWEGCFFTKDLPDLRHRLGGIGDPIYLHTAYMPKFDHALPAEFVTADFLRSWRDEDEDDDDFPGTPIDPKNPPVYESEASYLQRHGLLLPEEKRRLRKKDFEPEVISVDDDD